MRTEELLKQAETFKGREDSAFLHAEFFDGERGTAITVGELPSLILGIYALVESVIHAALPDAPPRVYFRNVRKLLKGLFLLYKMSKKEGSGLFPKSSFFIDTDKEEK